MEITCKNMYCPIQKSIDLIGGKWKFLIIWHLQKETLRNSSLKKAIPKITDKMLAQELKSLESHGLVVRKVYPIVPPKVEYSLTEKGKELLPILKNLGKWGEKYIVK